MSRSGSGPWPEPLDAPPTYQFPTDADQLLPWAFALERLKDARNYWLATSRPDRRPHVAPLWGVWLDDIFYWDGLPTTRWARNIARHPQVSINLESGADVVIVEGIADDCVTDEATGARIVADWRRKYGKLEPEPSTSGIFRLRPTVARGWSDDQLTRGTRWVFPPVDGG